VRDRRVRDRNVSEIIRKHYIFHGDVQGVGFRYRAYHAAHEYGVSGWVRNRYDGTVEMEAEGRAIDIEAVVAVIAAGRYVDIVDIEERTIPVCGSYSFEYR